METAPRASMLGGAVAAVPWLCYAGLLSFVLLAYLQVGHWPVYSRPDPKDVGFFVSGHVRVGAALIPIVLLLLPILASAATCATVLTLLSRWGESRRPYFHREHWRGLTHVTVSVAGTVLYWRQLGGLMQWLLD